MKVCLIIPALNEEKALPGVLGAVPRRAVDDILVVDNGSTDGTAVAARRAGARVVLEERRGYGAACWAGFQAAADAEILVFMDGDGSFRPEEIPRLTAPLLEGGADLVLGTRTGQRADTRAIPLHARLGNRFVSWVLRISSSVPATDLGPFRAVRRRVLEDLGMEERTYGWPCEMIVKAGRGKFRVVEVPVSYRPRTAGKSKVSGTLRGSLGAAFSILKVAVRWSLWPPGRS